MKHFKSVHIRILTLVLSSGLFCYKATTDEWGGSCELNQAVLAAFTEYDTALKAFQSDESAGNKITLAEKKTEYAYQLGTFYIHHHVTAEFANNEARAVFHEINEGIQDITEVFFEAVDETEDVVYSINKDIHRSKGPHFISQIPLNTLETFKFEMQVRLGDTLFHLYEKFHQIYAQYLLECDE